MKFKHIGYLFFTLLLVCSCNDNSTDNTTTSASKDAQIYSFSLEATHLKIGDSISRAQDSLRFLEVKKTKFVIDQLDRVIYNPDSLPYGLKLAKVKVSLSVNTNFGVKEIKITTPDSSYVWNTKDSVDFSRKPIYFDVYSNATNSSSSIEPRRYTIDVRVHKIDPDTLVWSKMNSIPTSSDFQKTLMFSYRKDGLKNSLENDTLYNFSIKNGIVSLFTAEKSSILNWKSEPVIGLPTNIDITSINVFNNSFYAVTTDGQPYISADGNTWVRKNNNKVITAILGVLPGATANKDVLLVVFKEGTDKYYFGKTSDFLNIETVNKISNSPSSNLVSSEFPKADFASVTNFSTTSSKNVLIVTGGKQSSKTWLIRNAIDGIEISSGTDNDSFKDVESSLFFYDNSLYALAGDKFYISDSWGDKWIAAPTKQNLDSRMLLKTGRTVAVDEQNFIWVFEQSASNKSEVEVWRGRVNRLITGK